jgi:high affinity choline transporter 7
VIDPFQSRFGKRWVAVLFIPAMLAEVFWSAELLVAVASSFDVILGIHLTSAILHAALVVTVCTMMGGVWSIAYTGIFQIGLVVLGLLIALPYILGATGGLGPTLSAYAAAKPTAIPYDLPSGTSPSC